VSPISSVISDQVYDNMIDVFYM